MNLVSFFRSLGGGVVCFCLLAILCVSSGTLLAQDIVINEFVASNDSGAQDQDGEYDDWIELYNTSNTAYSLVGHFLSDTITSLAKYDIPDTTIPAGGYLIVWCDEDGLQAGLHANFKLARIGESIYLMNSDTVIIDSINYAEQITDVAFGRCLNGSGDFWAMPATPAASNDCSLRAGSSLQSGLTVTLFPNPVRGRLQVHVSSAKPLEMRVFDLMGQEKVRVTVRGGATSLDVTTWPAGTYFIRLPDGTASKFVKL